MKSIVCHAPQKMEIMINQDLKTTLAKQEVLINIKRIGVCGTDIHAYGGNQPFFTYPRILGHELSGIVEDIGGSVEGIKKGDIVAVLPYMNCGQCIACSNGKENCCVDMKVVGVHRDGGMAETLTIPAKQVVVVNQLSLDEAAIIEPLGIGAHAIRRANIQKGETVLVIGAGPIGMGIARFAKLAGATTMIMDINEERLQSCKTWTESDVSILAGEGAYQAVLDGNDGELPTIVIDATGNKGSMLKAFDFVSHGGKLIYVGLIKDVISFDGPEFHAKELTLMGSRNATKKDFEYVIECIDKGLVKDSYITNKIKFNEVIDFFATGDFHSNKTVITIDE